jgi:hypothetical protein
MANNRECLVTIETSWYNVKRFRTEVAKSPAGVVIIDDPYETLVGNLPRNALKM